MGIVLKSVKDCYHPLIKRKARARWICEKCGQDVSLHVILVYEADPSFYKECIRCHRLADHLSMADSGEWLCDECKAA
jgi:ribosomal protein L37AE/L43A